MSQMDDYARHEALHMASFLENAVEVELVQHAVVRAEPEWLKLAETARKALGDLYLAIGLKHMPDDQSQDIDVILARLETAIETEQATVKALLKRLISKDVENLET